MLSCAVIGSTGYTGIELVKILLQHPRVKLTALTTRQQESFPIHTLIPTLSKDVDLKVEPYSFEQIKAKTDLVFLCLPHTEAAETGKAFYNVGKIVIDLSADFRLRSKENYESWYGVPHPSSELLKEAVYGLPEINRGKIKEAKLIANPGCYPTGSILGLAPLLARGLVETDSIIIDAKSGVSGAGKKLTSTTQFCEVDGNFNAYKVNKHQHMPEIEQTLTDIAGAPIAITFVPHLLPIERGILTTIYLQKKKNVADEQINRAFLEAYDKEPFVKVRPEGQFPSIKDVQRTNFCDIGFTNDAKKGRVIVITAIDNLVKGASGQAVQNMNIRMGFPEEEGLRRW